MLKIVLDGLRSLEYTCIKDGNENGTISISRDQFEKVKSILYNRKPNPNAPLSDYIDDFTIGPWGYIFPNYHEIHGGIVEDRYLYLILHQETQEGLEQLAKKLGLPTMVKNVV